MIREYDVSYAVKEFLLRRGWFLVAFNPPGSQGTLTIPNPKKDSNYRGQTGSESPDIIAYKKNILLVVESKPVFNLNDTKKLLNLLKDKDRLDLLIRISKKVCCTHRIAWGNHPTILVGKAHGEPNNLMDDIQTFIVKTKEGWDPNFIDPSRDPFSFMDIVLYPSDKKLQSII